MTTSNNKTTFYNLDDVEMKEYSQLKESQIRWHDRRIKLLTFSINLQFTITVAAIGLIINNHDFLAGKQLFCFPLLKSTLCISGMAAIMGIITILCRLCDFRLTSQITNYKIALFKDRNNIHFGNTNRKHSQLGLKEKLLFFREKANKVGNRTWVFFYIQSMLIATCILMLVLGLIM